MIPLYSFLKLFLIRRIEDKKYIPMISDRKSTTLLEDPLPTLETAKKNFIRFVRNPLTEITINIPMNSRDIYCERSAASTPISNNRKNMLIIVVTGSFVPASLKTTL
jgi:hypothetical protein